jgi:uncharacterized Ntn-hydrolase superfamily protein
MTFSIVARSGESLGIAVASKFLAVGAAVPAADSAAGALATQSYANLAYKKTGLALLREGTDAATVVSTLIGDDAGRDERQLGVVPLSGSGATYTGSACPEWAGGVAGDDYAIQGNILAGPGVIDAMLESWLATAGTNASEASGMGASRAMASLGGGMSLARRLLAALAAGDGAGGDRRGRQSAALLVVRPGAGYGGGDDVEVDLRMDDDQDPVAGLNRMLGLHELYFGRSDPSTLLELKGDLAYEVGERLHRLGHFGELEQALESWAGIENLEERLVPGRIDPLVLEHLRNC